MERNRYLQLASEAAMGKDVRVKYVGIEYRPISYTITPAEDGTFRHTVTVRDLNANSVVTAMLDAIEEVVE